MDYYAKWYSGRPTTRPASGWVGWPCGKGGEKQSEEAMTGPPVMQVRHICRAAKTGAWLMVLPSTVNRTGMGPQEWRNALFLRYGL